MLIDIPEQINCSYCDFLDYEQGRCWLALVKDDNHKCVGDAGEKGYRVGKENESRPDWCPFKAEQKNWEEHWIGKSLGANVYQFGNDLYFKEIDEGAPYRIVNRLIGGVIGDV